MFVALVIYIYIRHEFYGLWYLFAYHKTIVTLDICSKFGYHKSAIQSIQQDRSSLLQFLLIFSSCNLSPFGGFRENRSTPIIHFRWGFSLINHQLLGMLGFKMPRICPLPRCVEWTFWYFLSVSHWLAHSCLELFLSLNLKRRACLGVCIQNMTPASRSNSWF